MLQFFDGEKKFYRTVGTRVDIKDNDNKNDNDKTRKLGEIVIVSYNHKTCRNFTYEIKFGFKYNHILWYWLWLKGYLLTIINEYEV